jgi:hypothetical protein
LSRHRAGTGEIELLNLPIFCDISWRLRQLMTWPSLLPCKCRTARLTNRDSVTPQQLEVSCNALSSPIPKISQVNLLIPKFQASSLAAILGFSPSPTNRLIQSALIQGRIRGRYIHCSVNVPCFVTPPFYKWLPHSAQCDCPNPTIPVHPSSRRFCQLADARDDCNRLLFRSPLSFDQSPEVTLARRISSFDKRGARLKAEIERKTGS